jgi:UDP-glucose 4-epimerase
LVARLFNTYGPRETNPHVIPHILEELRKGPSVSLGNTSVCRDFTYVADLVLALLQIGRLDRSFDTFNVGTGTAVSIAEVLHLIEELRGEPIRIIREAERIRAVDRPYLCADSTHLKKATGWQPSYSLEEGLRIWLREMELLPTREALR